MNDQNVWDGVIISLSRIFLITYSLFNHKRTTQSLSIRIHSCVFLCCSSKSYRLVAMWAVADIINHVCKHKILSHLARCAAIPNRCFCSDFQFQEKKFEVQLFCCSRQCKRNKTRQNNAFWNKLCTKWTSWSNEVIDPHIHCLGFGSFFFLSCLPFSPNEKLIKLYSSLLFRKKENELNKPHLHAIKV